MKQSTGKVQENAPVGALLKGFGVIEQLSLGVTSLADISRRMGLPKSSTYRLLSTLAELGVVEKTEQEEYRLTPRLFQYGIKALNALDLVSTTRPCMNRLRDVTGETVHLAVRSGTLVIYVQKVTSSHSLRMDSRIGYQAPLYCTSLGKSLLAWLEPDEVHALMDGVVFEPLMPNTLTSIGALLEHLAEVRKSGYACDNEENEANVICFGAPIFDHYGHPLAALSVSMPKLRYKAEQQPAYIEAVCNAARDASRAFGCEHWPPDAK